MFLVTYSCTHYLHFENDFYIPLSVVVRRPPFSRILLFETAWFIEVKFHVEPAWERETTIDINGTGYMTNMAITPISGKNLLNIILTQQQVL